MNEIKSQGYQSRGETEIDALFFESYVQIMNMEKKLPPL